MTIRRTSFGILLLTIAVVATSSSQIGGWTGAYSRLGFGARGMGMANAMTAVSAGDIQGYYNPAVLSYGEYRNIAASFGILSLDRRLNFLSYAQPLAPNAGLAIAIINSGVSEIDGRDSDGEPTGPLQTSENQVMLSFSNRFKAAFSAGINLKFLYHHLYTDVTSVTVGVDFGVFVPVGNNVSLGASVRDINSKYKWDTSKLYGQSGSTTDDDFPLLYALGAAYRLPDSLGTLAIDVETSNQSTLIGRAGLEVHLLPEVTLRGGVDRIDLREKGNGIRPALGFSLTPQLGDNVPLIDPDAVGFHYTYIIEPFSSSGIHMISLSVVF